MLTRDLRRSQSRKNSQILSRKAKISTGSPRTTLFFFFLRVIGINMRACRCRHARRRSAGTPGIKWTRPCDTLKRPMRYDRNLLAVAVRAYPSGPRQRRETKIDSDCRTRLDILFFPFYFCPRMNTSISRRVVHLATARTQRGSKSSAYLPPPYR